MQKIFIFGIGDGYGFDFAGSPNIPKGALSMLCTNAQLNELFAMGDDDLQSALKLYYSKLSLMGNYNNTTN